jgi:hypothetical protein
MPTCDSLFVVLDAFFFGLGALICLMGVFVLVFRSSSGDVKELAHQAKNLAQKGIADEVSGLVGNTTALLDSLNQLVRTNRGIGLFLTAFGGVLMALSIWFVMKN